MFVGECRLTLDLSRTDRSVAAPLNPTYSEPENDFYLSDSSASLLLVPRLSKHDAPAVQAAKKRGVTVVEVWWDEKKGIEGRVLVQGKNVKTGLGSGGEGRPQGDDVALLLHTSVSISVTLSEGGVPWTQVILSILVYFRERRVGRKVSEERHRTRLSFT